MAYNPGRSIINVFGKVPKSKPRIPESVIAAGDLWARGRVAELISQGYQARVIRKRNEALCVSYNLRDLEAGTPGMP
jgi:hypothetical protein